MVGLPARGKALTLGRHGRGQEGLCAEMKRRGGAGFSPRRGGGINGGDTLELQVGETDSIQGWGRNPGSRLRSGKDSRQRWG